MLKKPVIYDTISLKIRWDCMNNNVLISTSILNALWEKDKKDTIDLLLPLLEYSIAQNTNVGEVLDTKKITRFFMKEFGYDSVPLHIVKIMLNRISPKILERKNNKYYLKVCLDKEVRAIEEKRLLYKEHSSEIAKALSEYLNNNYKSRNFSEDNVNEVLISFFVIKGICIIKDAEMLKLLKSSDDQLNYCIAQFILQERDKDSHIFYYIVDMVKGFFISSAIYFQPQNTSVTKAKFKNLMCYLDTSIILNALGLTTEEEKLATAEFLDMLKKENANLCIFQHNLEEVYDIIYAYKMSLEDPYNNRSWHTLEYFDKLSYKPSDVERYLSALTNKVTSLGIDIVEKPEYSEYTYNIDETGFAEHIKDKIIYRNDKALNRDIASVSALYRLRKREYTNIIERCKHIFITSNIKLVNVTNYYFKKEIKENVPLLISDLSLSAISWIKSNNTNNDYPKNKLIENVVSSVQPSSQLISLFFEKIDKLQVEGELTADEAAVYRTSIFCKRELSKATKGDPNSVNNEMLYEIFDRFKNQLSSKEKEKSELNYKMYLEQREKTLRPVKKALTEVDNIGQKAKKRAERFLWILYWFLFVIFFISGVACMVTGLLSNNGFVVSGIILVVFDIIGLLDLFLSKKSLCKKTINKISFKYQGRKKDEKLKEYEALFETLNLDRI